MAVLFISYKYPPALGGMQKQSYELITGYAAQHEVHKLVFDQNGSVVFFFMKLFWLVPRLMKKHPEIKLIHLNDGVCAVFCAWMKTFRSRAMVVTYHGLDLVFPNFLYQKFLIPLIRTFDGIITVSEYTRKECIKRGFAVEQVHVVKNGVDLSADYDLTKVDQRIIEFSDELSEAGRPMILAIGRPVKRKGFVWFLKEVITRLEKDCVFVLVGPEPQYSKVLTTFLKLIPRALRTQVELFFGLSTEHHQLLALGSNPYYKVKFQWFKNLNHDAKLYLLERADFLAMPNVKVKGDMEGFGLVALEAGIHNTAVIAAELEGITSAVIPEKNGWLIETENVKAWTTKINELLEHKPIIAARDFVTKNYGWDKMVQQYASTFNLILNQKGIQ